MSLIKIISWSFVVGVAMIIYNISLFFLIVPAIWPDLPNEMETKKELYRGGKHPLAAYFLVHQFVVAFVGAHIVSTSSYCDFSFRSSKKWR